MKRIITIAALLLAIPALADVGTSAFVSAGTITNATTRTTGFSDVKVDNRDNVGLQVTYKGTGAGTGAVTLIVARSGDGVTFESTPRLTFITALNGTTEVSYYTNLTSSVIGGAHSLRLISVQNADAVSATNFSATVVMKRIK